MVNVSLAYGEHLRNLRRIHVFLEEEGDGTMHVEGSCLNLGNLKVPLPVETSELLKSFRNGITQVTLHTKETKPFAASDYPIPLSLHLLQPVQLECKACGYELLKAKTRVSELPSEYWNEFIDCWMCHTTQDIKVLKDTKLSSTPDRIMSGGSYFLINSETLKDGPCGCGKRFGLQTKDGWKVPKYEVKVISSTRTRWCDFTDCFIYDVYSRSRAHAQFRYFVKGEITKLYIWIFNFDSLVWFPDDKTFNEAVKVLFTFDEQPLDDFEQLDYAEKHVQTLLETLQSSNSKLPASHRTMNNFHIGFIPKPLQ